MSDLDPLEDALRKLADAPGKISRFPMPPDNMAAAMSVLLATAEYRVKMFKLRFGEQRDVEAYQDFVNSLLSCTDGSMMFAASQPRDAMRVVPLPNEGAIGIMIEYFVRQAPAAPEASAPPPRGPAPTSDTEF